MTSKLILLTRKQAELISEIKELLIELRNIKRKYDEIEKQYFEKKINYSEYIERKKSIVPEPEKWEMDIKSDILKRIKEIRELNKEIVVELVNDKRSLKIKEVKEKELKVKHNSFFKAIKEMLKEIKVYYKDPQAYIKHMLSQTFKAKKLVFDEKILLYYNSLLKKYVKESSEELKELSKKRIKELKKEVLNKDIVSKEEIKKFGWGFRIQYWLHHKFKKKKPETKYGVLKTNQKSQKRVVKNKSKFVAWLEDILGINEKQKKVSVTSLIQLRKVHESARQKKRKKVNLFDEEIRAIKHIINEEKTEEKKKNSQLIYTPNFYGIVSNITMKKAGLWMINQFPDFFKNLYMKIQLGNINILSNTYINIMLFSSLLAGILGGILFFFIPLIFLKFPLPIDIGFSWFGILVGAGSAFGAFLLYPEYRISERKRSIRTNLPFAIIHMSAIGGSGMTPIKMIELVANNEEFGDVAVEFGKINKYVSLFGSDMITAIKATMDYNPSDEMKNFLEGLITTIESGGDLIKYLSVKSEEILLKYKLERDRLNDTLGIFSEAYMGLMITAPMFFILVVSIMGLLGGQVLGMSPKVLIALVTYFILPGMNVIFYGILSYLSVGY